MPALTEHWTVGLEGILVSQILSLLTFTFGCQAKGCRPFFEPW